MKVAATSGGLEPALRPVVVPERGLLQVELELGRAEEDAGLPVLRLADGRPVPRAFVLGLAGDGGPDYRCSQATDELGRLDFPTSCLAELSRDFYVLHPAASFQSVSASDLAGAAEIVLEAASFPQPRARLVDGEGTPLAGEAVALKIDEVVLHPNHFLAAFSRTGVLLPFRTDENGELDLGLVPAGRPLSIAVAGDGETEAWSAVPPAAPGEVVRVIVEWGCGCRPAGYSRHRCLRVPGKAAINPRF